MQTMNALSSGNYLLQSNGTSADHKIYDDKENYVIKHFDSDDVSTQKMRHVAHAM